MVSPRSSDRMIGRDAELGTLRDVFAAGRDGQPRVVVVHGEAGIGKTRLLDEFLREAGRTTTGPPVVVALGQCIDIGEIGAPYTPIRRLLRELYRGVGDDAFRAAARTPSVTARLGALLPELGDDAPAQPAGADQVTEAIESLIEGLSAAHHLVLVIEDMHWADAATLALLRTLSVTLRGAHVTVIMTYRSDDVGRGHPLRPLLADLERNRSVTAVGVRRLTADESAELARSAGADLSTEDLEAIASRSDGVPFFVEELVDLGGGSLPETLRGLVLARYERLSESARAVVGVVSAGGVRVEHALLEEVWLQDGAELRSGLREAIAENVLVADEDGYAFRHALIRESVHGDLLPNERAELHRRFAESLDRDRAAGDRYRAGEAAEHWLLARDLPRAFDATVVAREQARRSFASVSAAHLGERLLELWPQVPDARDRAGRSEIAMATAVAEEWRDLSDAHRMLRVCRAALASAEDDAVDRALLLRATTVALFVLSRHVDALGELRRGLALVETRTDRRALIAKARLMALMLAFGDSLVGGEQNRRELAANAVAAAETAEDPNALAAVLKSAAWVASDYGDSAASAALIRRIADLDVDVATKLDAIISETDGLIRMGRFADAVALGEPAVALATEVGLQRGVGSMISTNVGEALFAIGDAARADEVLELADSHLRGSPQFRSFVLRTRGLISSWGDRSQDNMSARAREADFISDACHEDAEEHVGWIEHDVEAALNRLADVTGSDRRRALVAGAIACVSDIDASQLIESPGLSRRILPGVARAVTEAALLGIDGQAGAELARLIDAIAAGLQDDEPARACQALIEAERARAVGDDIDHWMLAVGITSEGFLPVRYLHYARYRYAETLVAAGRRGEAAEVLAEIVTHAPAQGAAVVARWAHDLGARAGIPLPGRMSPAARSALADASLTRRELQVLELVADGLTNPQIGERLFISPKTASVHVSAILVKIGAANRTEAAALFAATPSAGP